MFVTIHIKDNDNNREELLHALSLFLSGDTNESTFMLTFDALSAEVSSNEQGEEEPVENARETYILDLPEDWRGDGVPAPEPSKGTSIYTRQGAMCWNGWWLSETKGGRTRLHLVAAESSTTLCGKSENSDARLEWYGTGESTPVCKVCLKSTSIPDGLYKALT